MITGRVVGSERVVRNLLGARELFQRELGDAMLRCLVRLHNHVVTDKLHGQVLHVRTGRLANSVNWRMWSEGDGDMLKGAVGTGVVYAAIHEYGGQINVPAVEGKLMVFPGPDGKPVFTMRHRAFTVRMPERSFLRSALSDQRSQIMSDLQQALEKVVRRING